jgi:peptidyl-tRNA hydrolase
VPQIKPKMLFVVNGQLKMGKGKICAQVGHGVIGAYLQIEEEAKFDAKQAKRLSDWEY